MKTLKIAMVLVFSGWIAVGCAQRQVNSQQQFWLGYMTNTLLNKKYSWWNDAHYVPGGFFIVRTGITRQLKWTNITAGYAYARLPLGDGKSGLPRQEHRPWGQAQSNIPLGKQWALIPRIRYDARFRQDVQSGLLKDSYSFNHRIRLMVTLRRFLTAEPTKIGRPFLGISDEVLFNAGKNVTFNHFDQNRVSLMIGTQYKNLQIQTGYMNRFVKTGPQAFTQNHTLVIWISHTLKAPHLFHSHKSEMDGE